VTTTAPGTSAVISDVGDDGDIILNFDIPKGDTGDVGAGLPPTSVADEGKTIFVTSTGSTELRIPSTTDVTEGVNLYHTSQRASDAAPVQSVNTKTGTVTLSTTDISEGTNLYYTNARVDTQTATNRSPLYFVENVRTANYTLVLADVAKVVAFNSASNLTLTVPANASVAFPLGTVINVYRAGTGTVTIAAASGVTLRNAGTIPAQFGERSLRKRGTNEWVLI
jgi:hypothetical protein